MTSAGFEPAMPAIKLLHTYAFDHTTTGTDDQHIWVSTLKLTPVLHMKIPLIVSLSQQPRRGIGERQLPVIMQVDC
jgi:hypothetical protein